MTQTRSVRSVICVALALFATCKICQGGVPSLQWDANPEPYIAGYNVYIGEESRVYTRIIDVGPETSIPLTNLNSGVTYYFAVTAYDTNRLESAFSDEVPYTPRVDGTNDVLIPFQLTVLPDVVVLQFTGREAQLSRVVVSSDLQQWRELHSVLPSADVLIEYLDTEAPNEPIRFYRVIQHASQPLTDY